VTMGYGLDGRISIPDSGKRFIFTQRSLPALRPVQSPTQWILGLFTLGIKRPGHETDNALPF
jgi:hypothetical protein